MRLRHDEISLCFNFTRKQNTHTYSAHCMRRSYMWIHIFFWIHFHAFIWARMRMDVKRLWFSMTKWMNEYRNMFIYRFYLTVVYIYSCVFHRIEHLLVFLLPWDRRRERWGGTRETNVAAYQTMKIMSNIPFIENSDFHGFIHEQHLWVSKWIHICFVSLHLFCIILNHRMSGVHHPAIDVMLQNLWYQIQIKPTIWNISEWNCIFFLYCCIFDRFRIIILWCFQFY